MTERFEAVFEFFAKRDRNLDAGPNKIHDLLHLYVVSPVAPPGLVQRPLNHCGKPGKPSGGESQGSVFLSRSERATVVVAQRSFAGVREVSVMAVHNWRRVRSETSLAVDRLRVGLLN